MSVIRLSVTITSKIKEVKMDANYIAYETLVASRAAALWAFWSMVGTWVSGIGTILAALFAAFSVNSWRKQDKAKSRREVKVALLKYSYALSDFPLKENDDNYLENRLKIYQALGNCVEKIVLCEDKKFLRKYINVKFSELQCVHREYVDDPNAIGKLQELANALATINIES